MSPVARATRVAFRYLAATASFAGFRDLFRTLELLIAESKSLPLGKYDIPGNWHKSPTQPMGLRQAFPAFMEAGREWSTSVVDNKAIPPGKHKPVEMAARLFDRTRALKDPVKWFEENRVRFLLLIEADTWPTRSEETGIRVIGPFQVHDTVGSSDADWLKAEQVITRAVRELPHTGLPGFASMAYGALYLVGQLLRGGQWAAWYVEAKDVVYLRPNLKGASVESSARILIHELAHRYWRKKLPMAQKESWIQHHEDMRSAVQFAVGRLPTVGEVLPFVSDGKKLRVDSYQHGYAYFVDATTGEALGKVHSSELQHQLAKEEARVNHAKYPTEYASTDAEEHFCEAVSLRAMGWLDRDNRAAFDQIFG